MIPSRLRVEIVTPQRLVISATVDEVVAPGSEGYFGVLPGHTPFITTLAVGIIMYRDGKNENYIAVGGGFAEVTPEKVIILAETAEKPEEVDIIRAEEAIKRAQERMSGKIKEAIDFDRAQASVNKAVSRIQVASRRR